MQCIIKLNTSHINFIINFYREKAQEILLNDKQAENRPKNFAISSTLGHACMGRVRARAFWACTKLKSEGTRLTGECVESVY